MASIEATNEPKSDLAIGARRLVRYGLYAAITAIVVNLAVLFIGLEIADFPADYVGGPFGPLAIGPVIINTTIAAIGATVIFGIIARYSANPARTFVIAAGIALVLSFAMFLAPDLAGAPMGVFAFLAVMHITAAVSIVGVLLRATKSDGVAR